MKKNLKPHLIWILIVTLVITCAIPIIVNGDTESKDVYITPFDPILHYESIGQGEAKIEAYKEDVELAINEVSTVELEDVRTTITFSEPITEKELLDIVTTYDLIVEAVELRHLVGEERYTSAIIFDGDWDALNSEIDLISEDLEESEYVGIIDIYAKVDSEVLEELSADPKIYLVDISGDAATLGSEVYDGDSRNEERFDDGIDDYPKALAWELEDIEMEEMSLNE